MRRHTHVAASVALLLTVGACGGGGGKAEAKTVTLLSHNAFAASKEVLADFTRQTGDKLKLLAPGDASVMLTQAILRKRHPIADVLYGIDNTLLTRGLAEDIFEPYASKGLASIPRDLQLDPEHRVTPVDFGDVCLNFDSSWFGHDGRPEPPTSIDDLTKPAYRDLTVVENPATASPGLVFLLATIKAKGTHGWQAYWRALRANGVRVDADWSSAYNTDFSAGPGKGDRPIVVSYGSSPPADVVFSDPHRDTPNIGVVQSSCFHQIEFVGVLKHARNPAGARAWIDFMVSQRFQEDMPLQMYVFPANRSAQLPDVFTRWAVRPARPYTMDPQTIGKHREAWIKEWTDIVVR